MKVIDHLEKTKEPLISFELIPPKRGGDISSILSLLDDLVKYRPPFLFFINIILLTAFSLFE